MIDRAKGVLSRWYSRSFQHLVDVHAPKLADNLKICSCSHCSNKRKMEGPTLQERRQTGDDE